MNLRRTLGLGTALLATTLAAFADQAWEYKYYKQGPGGAYERDRFYTGTIELREQDGKASLRIVANLGNRNTCLRGELPATVTRTDTTLTIEPQMIQGCEAIRYVIRTDGSGGERQIQRNERWVNDGFDHGLTPVAK